MTEKKLVAQYIAIRFVFHKLKAGVNLVVTVHSPSGLHNWIFTFLPNPEPETSDPAYVQSKC